MARNETWRETAAFWSYRALARVAPRMPEGGGHALAAALGTLAHRRLGDVRAHVVANQARVLRLDPGDARVRRSACDAFRLYARYWFDTFHLPALDPAALNARVDVPDLHHVDAALARGRGCLAVLPHLGNWDAAGRFLAVNGYRIAAVAEHLRPARLAALFQRHREALGMRIIPLIDPEVVRAEIVRLLAENWVVGLVADRSLSERGIAVEMFGAPRTLPIGPAWLARATGAPIVVAAVYTMPTGWHIRVRPPLEADRSLTRRADVTRLSQRLAAELERAIALDPADWHVFQPAWRPPVAGTSRRHATAIRPHAAATAAGRP